MRKLSLLALLVLSATLLCACDPLDIIPIID